MIKEAAADRVSRFVFILSIFIGYVEQPMRAMP